MRYSLRSFIAVLLIVCTLGSQGYGYSVLTHEEIIDLLWDAQIKPLLLEKYPETTADGLRVAHSYAYGGSLVQDMGYYPFGNRLFSDLVHYVRSGDFVEALLNEAADVNEYAFALGALAHYTADIAGHPFVNAAVAQNFPKLKAKYGPLVTFQQNPKAHIQTEFGFDVVQVAKHRYASDAYHDFIGFQVSKPALERAFVKTYGIRLEDVFGSIDLSIATFRRSISTIIPQMTRVALLTKKDDMVKEDPSFARTKFLYNLKRTEYEKEWGRTYQKPGFGAQMMAAMFRLLPKVGPFKAVGFKMPSPETETLYLKSVNNSVDQYRKYLQGLRAGTFALENKDFDTGKHTEAGEYKLTDDAYAALLNKIADRKFADTSPALRENILAFYQGPVAPIFNEKKPDERARTLKNIEELSLLQFQTTATR
ncbi:MAG TPA: zinc dependent phospholipase C family protein [Candidatus Saccharimonadales bacterium]|nr:zinc dependent phospholipase C family protein [Candidatus Saccharimonadales bacterium]